MDDRAGIALIVILILLLGVVGVSAYQDLKHHKKLLIECIEDGKKEYECESMLKGSDSGAVIIPMMM